MDGDIIMQKLPKDRTVRAGWTIAIFKKKTKKNSNSNLVRYSEYLSKPSPTFYKINESPVS